MLIPFCCVDGGPQSEPGSFIGIRGKLCMVYTLLVLMRWCVGSPHESSYGHINSLQPMEQKGNQQFYYKFIFLTFYC